MRVQDKYLIVLFDGVCNLCNNAVDLIITRDSKGKFKVGALQDEVAKKILKDYQIDKNYLDSLVFIHKESIYFKSRAALEISRNLPGLWPLMYVFIIIPSIIRDPIYDWIARKRYKWFGKKETCRIPNEEEKKRFLKTKDF